MFYSMNYVSFLVDKIIDIFWMERNLADILIPIIVLVETVAEKPKNHKWYFIW